MSDWADVTYNLQPKPQYYNLNITVQLWDYPHSTWQWFVTVQKPWLCDDGIYVPPLVNIRTTNGNNAAFSIERYVNISHPLTGKIFYAMTRDLNPSLHWANVYDDSVIVYPRAL